MRFYYVLLGLPILLPAPARQKTATPQGPVTHLASGDVRGWLQGKIEVFEGIPYAAPPVGSPRWREPQPVAKWSGVRDATKPDQPCMQNIQGTDSFIVPLAATYHAAFSQQPVDPSEDS